MSLIDEIRSDLVEESTNLSNTLRKAKILARSIGLPELTEWADSELNGYNDREKVPDYRRFVPTNFGTFSGPFGSGVKNVALPTSPLPDTVRDFAENLFLMDGVAALQTQVSDGAQIRWRQEMIMLARDAINMPGMVLVDAHQPIPAYVFSGVLDQVKNRLLDFVLGLEDNDVTPENLDNRTVEPEVARNVFNITIQGDRNIVASGEHVSQQSTQSRKNDIDSLIQHLSTLNIDGGDLDELRDAVSQETSVPSRNQYGPKLGAWLGGMMSKAATGAWNVGLETASKVLTDALNKYYFGA